MSGKSLGKVILLANAMLVLTPALVFDTATKLPDSLRQAAFKVIKLYSDYVAVDVTPVRLNWDGCKDAIAARSGPDLSVVKTKSTTIVSHTASVEDMAGKVSQYLYEAFSLQGTDEEHMRSTIYKAFQDVGSAASGSIITSSTHESRGRTWENHIVLMAPNPDDADSFYAVITTVGFSAYIYEYRGPLGIGNESRHDYSANITGMELLVKKTYRQ
ncbi:hypothetical protein V8D89_000161 [Ganoderma adspersum]